MQVKKVCPKTVSRTFASGRHNMIITCTCTKKGWSLAKYEKRPPESVTHSHYSKVIGNITSTYFFITKHYLKTHYSIECIFLAWPQMPLFLLLFFSFSF